MSNSFSIMSTHLFIDDVYSDGHHCILIKFYIYIYICSVPFICNNLSYALST